MLSSRDEIIDKALDRFYKDEKVCEIPNSLPIVEELCKEKLASNTFADMEVFFVQHHLGPIIPRIRSMINFRLDASRCWFVDIPYSTNSSVRD